MRNEAIAALVVILMAISGLAGYFVGSSAQRVTTNLMTTTLVSSTTVFSTEHAATTTTVFSSLVTTSLPYEPCSTQVSNESLTIDENATTLERTPVLLMRPNTTGYVCVIYRTLWQGNQSQFLSYGLANETDSFQSSGNPLNWTCVTYNESSMSCAATFPHAFTIQRLPSSVVLTGNLDYLVVVYAYSALGNSTGFYDETAPWWGCWGMPMAVGYPAVQVNATDFNLASILDECPPLGLNPLAEYTTGMNVTYVDIRPLPSA